ncbi:MAG: MaoC family dehydratase [Microbacterium sp.]|nr:MAG: MaoC family dehydratase [Microbacterium sp.]
MRVFTSLDEVQAAAGEEIGASDWIEVTQDQVNTFADATGDHQWIHVDVERAKAGPFGQTIAHGYLTLSMLPLFSSQVLSIQTAGAMLNYGINKVRFPNPVPVGAKVRGVVSFGEVTDLPNGKQLIQKYVVEIDGAEKPAAVAETVVLLLN